MILKHIYLALDGVDFIDTRIISDFNFQSDFITHFIEQRLTKIKFETNNFQTLTIRGRKEPRDILIYRNHFKSLDIEIPFNVNRYKELYPYENEYPLQGLLKPVINESDFNNFLLELLMQGFEKAHEQKAPIPYEFLLNTTLDFKANGFRNEWEHKTRTFKEYGVKIILFCKLTVNYFSLDMIIIKNKHEIFRKEILKTLPSAIIYKDEFKDIRLEDDKFLVTNDKYESPPLFELPLSILFSNK